MKKGLAFACLTLVLSSALAGSAHATKMLHHNLQELTQLAQRVFVGECLQANAVTDGELMYMKYDFDIIDGIKGVTTGSALTVRQFATGSGKISGFPEYEVGNTYLLFLRDDSGLGLTSPIGLGQGAFLITKPGGVDLLVNGIDNKGLFHRMDPKLLGSDLSEKEKGMLTVTKGAVDRAALVSLVKKLAQ